MKFYIKNISNKAAINMFHAYIYVNGRFFISLISM